MTADLNIWTSLMAFAGAAGLLTIVPGLDTLLVLRTATVEGPRRAMFAGLGICTGCLAWGILVSAGLGAVFAVAFWGTAVVVGHWCGILAVLIAFGSFWRKLTLEERFMRETFGSAYEEYRARTAALIPYLF